MNKTAPEKFGEAIKPFLSLWECVRVSGMALSVDVRGSTLVVILNDEPPPDWIRLFTNQPVRAYMAGAEPANWRFNKKEAIVSLHPHRIEADAPMILQYFDSYLANANGIYHQHLRDAARQREQALRRELQTKIEQEQRRQRILRSLQG